MDGRRPVARSLRLSSWLALCLVLAADPVGAQADPPREESFASRLVASAEERTSHRVTYDGSYRSIAYPMGDVPEHIGVCTDVVIRAYRGIGTDLQKLVHEDMKRAFDQYPALWGLSRPDSNIDHRRVPNLQRFFERHGESLAVSREAGDYLPGDLVTWMLPGNLPHIGIVSETAVAGTGRREIIHNIGGGPVSEDMLFRFEITGHYRFQP